MAKHDIVGKYIGMTARERIGYIYKNYKDLDYLKESYRDYAVFTVGVVSIYNEKRFINGSFMKQTNLKLTERM